MAPDARSSSAAKVADGTGASAANPHVEVVVTLPVPTRYTYRVPPALAGRAVIGSRVLVRFGARKVTGVVVRERVTPPVGITLVDVTEVLDDTPALPTELVELCLWVSDYYEAPLGEVMRAALPAGSNQSARQVVTLTESGRAAVEGQGSALPGKQRDVLAKLRDGDLPTSGLTAAMRPIVTALTTAGLVETIDRRDKGRVRLKQEKVVELAAPLAVAREAVARSPKRFAVIDALASGAALSLGELDRVVPNGRGAVRELEKDGLVRVFQREQRLDAVATGEAMHVSPPPVLTDEQRVAVDSIVTALGLARSPDPVLATVTPATTTDAATVSVTESATESVSNTATATDVVSATASDTNIVPASNTIPVSDTVSASYIVPPPDTDIGSASDTDIGSASDTDIGSASDTDTVSASASASDTDAATATATDTATATATATDTATATATATATDAATAGTSSPTDIVSTTATDMASTATATVSVASATATATATATDAATAGTSSPTDIVSTTAADMASTATATVSVASATATATATDAATTTPTDMVSTTATVSVASATTTDTATTTPTDMVSTEATVSVASATATDAATTTPTDMVSTATVVSDTTTAGSPDTDTSPPDAATATTLAAAAAERKFAAFLLHGVTGSGKTEVYLRVIAEALQAGRTALVLVPEISLTPQLAARFRARFGDLVAILHSGLSEQQRLGEWSRLRRGDAKIAVGARSAVFAPLAGLGVIVVDEEHDGSYKQDEGVRYHARDVALVRAQRVGAVCVLGSATPSLETATHAERGQYGRLTLTQRPTSRPMPVVEIVDLKTWMPDGEAMLSAPLRTAIAETLAAGDQTILFLNRRGFATFVLCTACGHSFRCLHCSVSMTYHRHNDRLSCHYCNRIEVIPENCPKCRTVGKIERKGLGTEKVAAAVAAAFPQARVARLDRDVASGAKVEAVLSRVARREVDVLVGTQMVTKGHDFPGVTLVGVLCADTGLSLPDFRAAERTFQLLAQVAGRAGRGDRPGRVLIQTYRPQAHAVVSAAAHDYAAFYAAEMADRVDPAYPPHARLIVVKIDGSNEQEVAGAARSIAEVAEAMVRRGEGRVEVLGPVPAPIERLRGRTRWQVWLRSADRHALRRVARGALGAEKAKAVRVALDVDPISTM